MTYDKYQFRVPEEKMVRLITDTDAKNEADDQFAIVQTLLSPKVDNVGFIAAHYGIGRHSDSMMRSYAELETIFSKMAFPSKDMLFKGADRPLSDTKTPVKSEGADLIITEAMKDDRRPLFVASLGPLTALASAFLLEPRIAGRFTAIWIGGGSYPEGGIEFNLGNDINAANIVFSSGIKLWQIPKNVYEMMALSYAELECKVRPYGAIGRYLFDQLMSHAHEAGPRSSSFRSGETWVLGDNPAIGIILYEGRFSFDTIPAPEITKEMHYIHTGRNPAIRVYNAIDSRLILEDMFCKIKLFAEKNNEPPRGKPRGIFSFV
jgi:inosine-uridine nucleoside N-ribohydrolase